MAIRTRTVLKNWFQRTMKPTASQFSDWIDSFFHKDDSIESENVQYTGAPLNTALNDIYQRIANLQTNGTYTAPYSLMRDTALEGSNIDADLSAVEQAIGNLYLRSGSLRKVFPTLAINATVELLDVLEYDSTFLIDIAIEFETSGWLSALAHISLIPDLQHVNMIQAGGSDQNLNAYDAGTTGSVNLYVTGANKLMLQNLGAEAISQILIKCI